MHLLCFTMKRRWPLNLENLQPLHHLMTNTECLLMIGIKDGVFKASSTCRHTTELNNLLTMLNDSNPMLMLYTDGGPDH